MTFKFRQLSCILLFAISAIAQVDVQVPWKGPFGDIYRGAQWGVSGVGGVNNAFIIQLPSPQLGGCAFVRNNDVAQHSFKLNAYITSDQKAIGYYTNTSSWQQIKVGIPAYYNANPNIQVGAGSLGTFSFSPASGSRVALVISGSSSSGTTDLFYSFGNPSPCSAVIPSNAQLFTDYRSNLSSTTQVNWIGTFSPQFTYVASPQDFSACTFYLWTANVSGTTPTLNVRITNYDTVSGTYDDKVSFIQSTTGTQSQTAVVSFDTQTAPRVSTNNSLAAGSVAGGRFSDSININYTFGGTSPVYNIILSAICR